MTQYNQTISTPINATQRKQALSPVSLQNRFSAFSAFSAFSDGAESPIIAPNPRNKTCHEVTRANEAATPSAKRNLDESGERVNQQKGEELNPPKAPQRSQ